MNATSKSIKGLLLCGAVSSIWYLIINIIVPMKYPGYSAMTYTVSELSAIGSPTRPLWIILVLFYPILFGLFGLGIRKNFKGVGSLEVLGTLIIAYSVFNLYWPPMHQRGSAPSLTDTLHIIWAGVTILLMMIMMVTGAIAFGLKFRMYTALSIILHILFGILTSLESPNIPTDGPTPFIGLWERINIGVFMLWVIVLSFALMRRPRPQG